MQLHGAHNSSVAPLCEAVVAETCFLLARAGFDSSRALVLVERGVVRVAMSLSEQVSTVRALFDRYDNVPASLADACLVRMSELYDPFRGCHIGRRLCGVPPPRAQGDSGPDAVIGTALAPSN